MTKEEKCVVLLSGGVDSSTLAYWARDQGYKVHTMACKYGQTPKKEVECAIRIAEKLGAPIRVIDLSSLQEIFNGMTPSGETIPLTSRFRLVFFSVFFSTAVTYAIAIGAQKIFSGFEGSDSQNDREWRRKFHKSFQTVATLATGQDVPIEAPFAEIPKSAIIKLGSRLGVHFEFTWSCNLNGRKHCGTCPSCVNRKKAFSEAAVPDPTEYNE